MKKIKIMFSLLAVALLFGACEQESLNPLPPKIQGMYVAIDFDQVTLELNKIETTAIRATLTNPGSNITRYELFTQRRDSQGEYSGPMVPLLTVNSFPYQLAITPQMLADAIGIEVSEIAAGDIYRFIAYSYDAGGTKVGYNNLSAILRTTESMKQGYRWSCDARLEINPDDPFNPYTPFIND